MNDKSMTIRLCELFILNLNALSLNATGIHKTYSRDNSMNATSLRRYFVLGAICILVLAGKAFGQAPGTGAISGVIYDPSNRVIAGAEVLAVNEATHVSRSVISTAEGVFRVLLLPPGSYSVTVA